MQPPPVVTPTPSPRSPFDVEAKKKLQRMATIKIVCGFMGSLAQLLTLADPNNVGLAVFLMVVSFGFTGVIVWGCCDYARSKGYSWALGFVGLLGCIGLIVLVVLPDKWKPSGEVSWPTNYPRYPGG